MWTRVRGLALLGALPVACFFGCKDLKIEDPFINHRVAADPESEREDAAYTRAFNDTHCPRANTLLTRRRDIGLEIIDVTACGTLLRYRCIEQSVNTTNARGEHKAQMVYECTPFNGGPDGGDADAGTITI
jgi:hypothetical protein